MEWVGAVVTWYAARAVFVADVPRRHRWRATILATVVALTLLLSLKLRQ